MRAILIPWDAEKPIQELDLRVRGDSCLEDLQAAVGGNIQALPAPPSAEHARINCQTTAYVNEDGKYTLRGALNPRATVLMQPVLFSGDFIVGNMIVSAFNPRTGNTVNVPQTITPSTLYRALSASLDQE